VAIYLKNFSPDAKLKLTFSILYKMKSLRAIVLATQITAACAPAQPYIVENNLIFRPNEQQLADTGIVGYVNGKLRIDEAFLIKFYETSTQHSVTAMHPICSGVATPHAAHVIDIDNKIYFRINPLTGQIKNIWYNHPIDTDLGPPYCPKK
jgi:hypothetical protein